MRPFAPLLLAMGMTHLPAVAAPSDVVYRCPGPPVVYTDQITAQEAEQRGCKPIEPVTLSVKESPKPSSPRQPVWVQACGTTDPKTGRKGPDCIDADALSRHLREQAERVPKWEPKKLGPVDQWRYESCQQDAAKAPTESGVRVGMRLCREKFGQQPPG